MNKLFNELSLEDYYSKEEVIEILDNHKFKPVPNYMLFHISFKKNIGNKIWYPRNPLGSFKPLLTSKQINADPNNRAEPDLDRISTSNVLEKCFLAIYYFVSKTDIRKQKELEYYVYTPIFKGHERVLYPEDLINLRFVYDAHATNEHVILDPVYMKLHSKIKLKIINKKQIIHYYDNPKLHTKEILVEPEITLIKIY